jgi:DNA-binding beta-propeller fold protein YncE
LNRLVEPAGSRHRLAWLAGTIALVSLALLGITARANASETLFWDNYSASPTTIGFANIDGIGGGVLNNASVAAPGTEVELNDPEGLAYDPANGRIYVANSNNDNIVWVSIDGSGAGILDTGAVPVEDPEGIAVDPATQTVYWANTETAGTIGFASANEGSTGVLNTTGATIKNPYKIALDTVNGRVYWIGDGGAISYANLNNTGGANLSVPPTEAFSSWSAINVNPATNQLYVLGRNEAGVEGILLLSTLGLGGSQIALEEPAYDGPYGLAFDSANGRFYWANYGASEERARAFGTTTLTAGAAGAVPIGIATAPLDAAQDPVIVKSPVGTGAPKVTASGTQLSCSPGDWEADLPGSYVYAAPTGYAYQWSKDGASIGGATGSSYTATASGSYSCAVTASNRSGSASQASPGSTVTIAPPVVPTPASLKLKPASKKPVKVKAGKTAVVKIDIANSGGTASGAVKVCGKLGKQAKVGLLAPKCATVKSVPAGKTAVAKLMVKTKASAKGTYKFTVNLSGAVKASLTAKVQVVAAKAKKPKHVSKGR